MSLVTTQLLWTEFCNTRVQQGSQHKLSGSPTRWIKSCSKQYKEKSVFQYNA